MRFSLNRVKRVRKSRDFNWIQRHGARGNAEHLVMTARKRHPGTGRIGLTVSAKVGNAVKRNLVKRRLREILRVRPDMWSDIDLVVIARPGAAELSFVELTAQVEKAHAGLRKSLKKAKSSRPPVRHSGRRDKK